MRAFRSTITSLPTPGIVKPLSKHRFNIEIYQDEIFFKLLTACDEVAILVKDQAIAIEDQLPYLLLGQTGLFRQPIQGLRL